MHERFTLLMSRHLDAVATPVERLELAKHLLVCPTCAAAWEQWQAIDRLLAMTPSAVPSRNLAADISMRLRRQAPFDRELGWLPVGLLVSGMLSVTTSCLAIAWLLWWGWHHPVEVAGILSSGAKALSGVSWVLEGIETVIRALNGLGLAASLATGVICSGGLFILWIWVLSHAKSSTGSSPVTLPSGNRRFLRGP